MNRFTAVAKASLNPRALAFAFRKAAHARNTAERSFCKSGAQRDARTASPGNERALSLCQFVSVAARRHRPRAHPLELESVRLPRNLERHHPLDMDGSLLSHPHLPARRDALRKTPCLGVL